MTQRPERPREDDTQATPPHGDKLADGVPNDSAARPRGADIPREADGKPSPTSDR